MQLVVFNLPAQERFHTNINAAFLRLWEIIFFQDFQEVFKGSVI